MMVDLSPVEPVGCLASAATDIARFRHHYRSVFSDGRESARTHLKAVQSLLRTNPDLGHPVDGDDSVREFPVKGTPFSRIYRVTDAQIEILRLWDNRQGDSR